MTIAFFLAILALAFAILSFFLPNARLLQFAVLILAVIACFGSRLG